MADDSLAVVPHHVAIIMDGNNRWAKAKGLRAVASGHQAGVEAIRGVLDGCLDAGVKVLTLFAFSSENWQRPSSEVNALMNLFSRYLSKEIPELNVKGTRVRFIGRRDRFSKSLQKQMQLAEELTDTNTEGTLVIAADYGGQWDITQAMAKLFAAVKQGVLTESDISEEQLASYLSLADIPAPDLLIRTGGEQRISNFLLWQTAYSELYFTDTYWPDFSKQELRAALADYAQRERRFGHTSEQIGAKTSA
ncbi:MAG: undecaprenyl diphosphate synthase [Porticoccus sp.]|jgi:undecaprenyl diphosphate synthase